MPTNTKRDDNPVLTKADTKRAIRFQDQAGGPHLPHHHFGCPTSRF